MKRMFVGSAVALSVACLLALAASTATAQVTKDSNTVGDQITHEGTVVSITGKKLVMRAGIKDKGEEHTHTLAANAKVTCDGKTCVLSDLKPGQRVRVTTMKSDPAVATRVEALDKQKTFDGGTIGGGKGGGAAYFGDKNPPQVQRDKATGGDKDLKMQEGTVVSVSKNKLVFKGKGTDTSERTCMVAPDAKITCDGKACALTDLTPGTRVRVTSTAGDRAMASRIEALDKQRTFSDNTKDRSK